MLENYEYDLPLTPEDLKAKIQKQLSKTAPDGTLMPDIELSETFAPASKLSQKLFGGSISDIMEMPEVCGISIQKWKLTFMSRMSI